MYLLRSILRKIVPAVLTLAILAAGGRGLSAQEDPPPEVTQQRINQLIEQLGNDNYSVRQRAQEELAKIGFEAYEALTAAANHEDLEISARARYLLVLIPAQWTAENDPPEVQKYLELYPQQPPEVRLQVMRLLAWMPGGTGVPALCRLVRFEKEMLLSKHAAVEVLRQTPEDKPGEVRFAQTVRKHLGRSPRPGAKWLIAFSELRKDPKEGLAAWTKLVEAERAVLKGSPRESSPAIVAALLYYLAMTQADQGNRELAETTAAEARGLGPGTDPATLAAHLDAARDLQRRGMLPWAEAEYRHVIDSDSPKLMARAQVTLSEMLHDRGDNLAAAEVLQGLIGLIEQNKVASLGEVRRAPGEIRARHAYFLACHWLEQGDAAQHRKYLEEAIQADPAELDVLIACYRLPNPEPEFRKETVGLIEKAAAALREAINETSDEPVYFNQFAWLVGNTQGDLDEALKYSKRSLELSPDSGAYYDTLAHVYFGRGDYENAVKHQARAAELEPHSGLITKKLGVFRAALEKSRQQRPKTGGEASPEKNPPNPTAPGQTDP